MPGCAGGGGGGGGALLPDVLRFGLLLLLPETRRALLDRCGCGVEHVSVSVSMPPSAHLLNVWLGYRVVFSQLANFSQLG